MESTQRDLRKEILDRRQRKIILIDDEAHKGWATVFEYMFKKVFGDLASFLWLRRMSTMDEFYTEAERLLEQHQKAYFILDNDFGDMTGAGMQLLKKWGMDRAICMHTASYEIGFDAAMLGAKLYIRKDDPANPKSNDAMQDDVHNLILSICKHFDLAPELAWLLFLK